MLVPLTVNAYTLRKGSDGVLINDLASQVFVVVPRAYVVNNVSEVLHVQMRTQPMEEIRVLHILGEFSIDLAEAVNECRWKSEAPVTVNAQRRYELMEPLKYIVI